MQELDRGSTTPSHFDHDEYESEVSPGNASYDHESYRGGGGPSGSSAPASGQKTGKKRGRHMVSCAECRRLKLRCDRQVPCSNCVKRRCSEICPHGTRKRDARKKSVTRGNDNLETNLLRTEKERLERLLDSHGIQHQHQHLPDPRDRMDFAPLRPYSPPTQDDWGANRLHTLASHASAISPRSLADRRDSEAHSFPGLTPIRPPPFDSPFPPLQTSPLQRTEFGRPEGFWGRKERDDRDNARVTPPSGNLAHGTLVLGDSGRSRYLGPSAGTEWIRKSERVEGSRPPSPSIQGDDQPEPATNWPFGTHAAFYTTAELFAKLPGEAEGASLVNAYFRFFAWNHNPVPRAKVNQILGMAYAPPAQRCHIQQLALLYSIFAIGTLHSLEYEPNDPIAEEYRQLAQACLSKGDFLIQNTIPGVQALYNLGHFYSESEQGKSGDQAWPLWGLAMRLVQAMGVHRDGSRWNLPPEVVEERRMVFWECHTMDIFQSHCFSRPATMRPKHTDTQYPSEIGAVMGTVIDPPFVGEYQRWKYELARIFEGALDHAMNVEPPAYSHVVDLYDQLCAFERSVPYHMRCRTALLATPSRCPDQAVAIAESPEVNRSDLKKTFEQFTLAINITEAILFLQRPYFARALQEEPMDAMKSKYGQSFLAVVERCNVTTQIVCGLVELFPRVAVRHWFYWYHLFNAAVCIGTLLLRSPHSPVAPYTLSVLDQAIGAYAIAVKEVGSPSLKRNHGWLVRLRHKGGDKVASLDPTQTVLPSPFSDEPPQEAEGDGGEELLAWRTRLVERAAKGIKRAISISTSSGPLTSPRNLMSLTTITAPPSLPLSAESMPSQGNIGSNGLGISPLDVTNLPLNSMGTADAVMQQHFAQPPVGSEAVDPNNAMDVLLNQFWDPMLLPDSINNGTGNQPPSGTGPYNSINWWTWDQSSQPGPI